MPPRFLRPLAVRLASAAAMLCVMSAAQAQVTLPHVAARLSEHQPLKIVAFGSSSTEGVGASGPAHTYPARLKVELAAMLPDTQIIVLNRGIGGQDVDDMIPRIPGIIAEHPDLVIWQTGTNDPLRGVPLQHFIDRTRAGIATLHEAGIDVMLMGPQLCRVLQAHGGGPEFRIALRQTALRLGVPTVHRFELMSQWLAQGLIAPHDLLSADGLHMADGGYALLAREVAREILLDADGLTAKKPATMASLRGE